MLFNVWFWCPIHGRWEKDTENVEWDEAVKIAKSISLMTGQFTAIENGAERELSMVPRPDARS